jgi:acetyl-CoA acetyltransferase
VNSTTAIVGAAASDIGAAGSALHLQADAALAALEDAGLDVRAVDGLCTAGSSRFGTTLLAEYLGIQPRWTDGTFAGGASFEVFVGHAADAIRAGRCETVVIAYGSAQRANRSRQLHGVSDQQTPSAVFEGPYRPLNPISFYAMAAQRHMFEFGTTPEHMAEVAVAARSWALQNPQAFRYESGPLTIDDVLDSPMVSSPLHKLDCCLVTDGGGALVLTTVERARSLRPKVVTVLGYGENYTHDSMSQVHDLTITGAARSSADALTQASLSLSEIDVVQMYDSFTITVLLTLEALGFCGRGESGEFVADGRLRFGGTFPMNTSGGGLSYRHPGMFGIFLLIEAVSQLRGEAGARQLAKHQTALCHATGGIFSTHSTVILGVE